jgi:hypothetical protein
MIEPDDRLAGDPVWEMFPTEGRAPRSHRSRDGLAAAIILASWFWSPPLSVTLACLAAAIEDLRTGRRLARSIPDKAGGGICSLFSYAWGAWKLGMAGFVLMFVTIIIHVALDQGKEVPSASFAAMLFWFAGFMGSAGLTAAGLVKAYRSGMRVWIGEGINQARTLMLAMLIVGFTFAVLMPLCLLLASRDPRAGDGREVALVMLGFIGCLFGGPVVILVVLDQLSRHVVADTPGKFGPKVPTVGKWNS